MKELSDPGLIGRDYELSVLRAELDQAIAGRVRFVMLEGRSGDGKTRLLDELSQLAEQRDVWVIRGQGADQGQRPFQMFEGMVAALEGAVREYASVAQRLRQEVGKQAATVCATLPGLKPVLLVEDETKDGQTAVAPEAFGEIRSLTALSSLLNAIGTDDRPVALLLDDCQWADEFTLRLLLHWWRLQSAPAIPDKRAQSGDADNVSASGRATLVVAAYREEEVPDDHVLRGVKTFTHLKLAPLRPAEMRALVESMAEGLSEEAVSLVIQLANGSPFMGAVTVRGMIESGVMRLDDGGWRVNAHALANLQSSSAAAELLAGRFRLLSPDTLRILSAGAILGKEFDIESAARLAGFGYGVGLARLADALERSIIWQRSDLRCVFWHDKLRETLLQLMTSDERKSLHLKAAELLETQTPQSVADLAYHFDAAAEPSRALPYALQAAKRARGQYALGIAERQYHIAEHCRETLPISSVEALLWDVSDPEGSVRYQIAKGLGDVLMLRGRYADAAKYLEDARTLAQDDMERTLVDSKLGELAMKRGDMERAREALERGLNTLGWRVPASSIGYFMALLREVATQTLHCLLPRIRRKREAGIRERTAMQLLSKLAYSYWYQCGRIPSLWAHLREMNVAECYAPSAELAQAYSEHAPAMTVVNWFSRGLAYAERSYAIRTDREDTWGQGQSLNFWAVALYASGRFRESIARAQEAMRLLERTGDMYERNTARLHLAYCHYRLGNLREAAHIAQELNRDAIEMGDGNTQGGSVQAWVMSYRGKVPPEVIQTALKAAGKNRLEQMALAQAEAVRLMANGATLEAVEKLEDTMQLVIAAGFDQEYTATTFPWLASALRQAAEETPDSDAATRADLLRRGAKIAGYALKVARRYPNNLPHALREVGRLAALRGNPRAAMKSLNESLRIAEQQEARYEAALTRIARGEIGSPLGWPDAASDLEKGRTALSEIVF